MAFKRPLSVSPTFDLPEDESKKTITQEEHASVTSHCLVCGDKAQMINYGALSCPSCKTFFRRKGFRDKGIRPCRFGEHCEINMNTRRVCMACRLAKCFAVGMSRDLIRKEDLSDKQHPTSTSNSNELVITQLSMDLPELQTLDLLRADRSILSTSEWTLLSNVVHAYDTRSVSPELNHFIRWFSVLPPTTQLDVSQTLDTVSLLYKSAHLFIGSTADYRILAVAEQESLFERNADGVTCLYAHLICRDVFLFGDLDYKNIMASVYADDDVRQTVSIIARLDPDPTFGKLMLVILAFSSTCSYAMKKPEYTRRDSLLKGTFRLFGSQNIYVELLWKYMVHRYGHRETVIRFAALIKYTLDMITFTANIYRNNQRHEALIDEIIDQAKHSLSIGEIDSLPLWGRT